MRYRRVLSHSLTVSQSHSLTASLVKISELAGAAGDRDGAGARHLDQTQRLHQRDERVELLARPGHLEHKTLGRRVHHPRPEDIGKPQRLDPSFALAGDLDPGQLALDRG